METLMVSRSMGLNCLRASGVGLSRRSTNNLTKGGERHCRHLSSVFLGDLGGELRCGDERRPGG